MGKTIIRGSQGSGQSLCKPPFKPEFSKAKTPRPTTSFLPPMPISPWDCPSTQCWKCSLLTPNRRHSSGQEGQLQSPGLCSSPPPGADPNRSVQEMPHFCCFVALTTNIQVETINTPASQRWEGADLTRLDWFCDVAPAPHAMWQVVRPPQDQGRGAV